MEAVNVYVDTHVIAWLYAGDVDRLSRKALRLLEKGRLLFSPISFLELSYLHEIGRLRAESGEIFKDLSSRVGLKMCELPFSEVASQARFEAWTRDPFDRIVVAHARLTHAPLVTADRLISQNYARSVA